MRCPVTGRTWPAEKKSDLRKCINCGGFIDIRVEAWKGESDGKQPRHIACPVAHPTAAATPQPAKLKQPRTGAEILAEIASRKDTVHDNILNR